jgi:hypothetical protein
MKKTFLICFKKHFLICFNSECPRKWDTSLSSKSQIWTKFFSQPLVTLKTPPPKKKFAQRAHKFHSSKIFKGL